MTDDLDPDAMRQFCQELLPELLVDVCGVAAEDAERASRDVLGRAEGLFHLDYRRQEVLAAPFFEETFDHEPLDAPPWLKAITTVVIRNGVLEELHANGPVEDGGLQVVTRLGLGPLSHLRVSRKRSPADLAPSEAVFDGLADRYPRAWACLDRLRDLLNEGGGRLEYRPPDAPAPDLPGRDELVEAPSPTDIEVPSDKVRAAIFSGIDPRFDQSLYAVLEASLDEPGLLAGFSALSRISRNSDKLLRVLDFLLAHKTRVLTTNYLLTDGEVWVRRKKIIKPDSHDFLAGFAVTRGLSGAHRKTAESYLAMIGAASGT